MTRSNRTLVSPTQLPDLSTEKFDDTISFNQDTLKFDLQRQDNTYDELGNLLAQTKEFSDLKDKGTIVVQSRKQNNVMIARAI